MAMKKLLEAQNHYFSLISFASLLSVQVMASDFPEFGLEFLRPESFKSDSGIHGPSYQKIVENLVDLEKIYPSFAETLQYGETIEKRPLVVIKIGNRNLQVTNAKAIYIGGSIHGDEYLNIEDRLPEWFLKEAATRPALREYFDRGGFIYIVPILNPDGYEHRQRENLHDADLNRDYRVNAAGVGGFQEPETKALSDYLERDILRSGKSLQLAVDYHCCIGALLYPWSFRAPSIPQEDLRRAQEIGNIARTELGTFLRVGTTPVILGYEARGTSKDYYYETFKGALGFTFEGRRNEENKHFDSHTRMWDQIIARVNLNVRDKPVLSSPFDFSQEELSSWTLTP